MKDLRPKELKLLQRKTQMFRYNLYEKVLNELSIGIEKILTSPNYPFIDPTEEMILHLESIKHKYNKIN